MADVQIYMGLDIQTGCSLTCTKIQLFLFGVIRTKSLSGKQINTDTTITKGVTRPLWIDFDEIFRKCQQWLKEQINRFWWLSGSLSGSRIFYFYQCIYR